MDVSGSQLAVKGQGTSLRWVWTVSPLPFPCHNVCKGRGNPEPSTMDKTPRPEFLHLPEPTPPTPGWTNEPELKAQRKGTPMHEGRGPGDLGDQGPARPPQPPARWGQVLAKSLGAPRGPPARLRDLPPRRVVTPAVSASQGVGARGGHGLPGHPGRPPQTRPVRGLRGGRRQVSFGSGTPAGRVGGRGGAACGGLRPQAQAHLEVPPGRRSGRPMERGGCHGAEAGVLVRGSLSRREAQQLCPDPPTVSE